MRLTIKTALIGIVCIFVALLAGQAWLAVSRTAAMNANAEDVATNWLPSIRSLGEIKFLTTRIRLNGARMVMTTGATDRRKVEDQLEQYANELEKESKKYQAMISSPEEKALWTTFTDKWQAYERLQKRVYEMAATNPAEAILTFNEQGIVSFGEVLKALDSDLTLNEKGADAAVTDTRSTYSAARTLTFTFAGLALVIGVAAALFVIFRITKPLQRLNSAMTVIAGGDLEAKVVYADRSDEIGDMAKALTVFKENGLRVRGMEAEQKAAEQALAVRRREEMIKLAGDFEGAVGEIVDAVTSAATELEASANTLSSTASHAQEMSTTVAAASEQASANVQSVASATEELSSSVNEIGRQVQEFGQDRQRCRQSGPEHHVSGERTLTRVLPNWRRH